MEHRHSTYQCRACNSQKEAERPSDATACSASFGVCPNCNNLRYIQDAGFACCSVCNPDNSFYQENSQDMETPTHTAPPVALYRLVRLARGRWLYAFSLDAETWSGCCKNLDDAVEMAFREAADEEREAGTKIYFAHGYPMRKSECDNLGLDWPWYEVDPADAITIILPNDNR